MKTKGMGRKKRNIRTVRQQTSDTSRSNKQHHVDDFINDETVHIRSAADAVYLEQPPQTERQSRWDAIIRRYMYSEPASEPEDGLDQEISGPPTATQRGALWDRTSTVCGLHARTNPTYTHFRMANHTQFS
jgi:hypothetical protein